MAFDNIEMSLFSFLPEDCIASIVSLTSPKDACTAAAVSLAFKSAADSDAVWDRFLPPDYEEIVAGSSSPVTFSTKKELFFLLCDSPLLIDGGKMSVQLNKLTGKKCYMLRARELHVVWIDNPVHWEWKYLPDSRFGEVAELESVCWLDVEGILKAQTLSPNTNYVAYIVFKLSNEHYGLDGPSKASVKFVKENGFAYIEDVTSPVYIVRPTHRRVMGRRRWARLPATNVEGRFAQTRADGWVEIELGEFFIGEGEEGEVHVKLCETQYLNWKRGLIVEGIEVRPK